MGSIISGTTCVFGNMQNAFNEPHFPLLSCNNVFLFLGWLGAPGELCIQSESLTVSWLVTENTVLSWGAYSPHFSP